MRFTKSSLVTVCLSTTLRREGDFSRDVEKLCYIGGVYDTVLKTTFKEKTCELSDGNVITVYVFTR